MPHDFYCPRCGVLLLPEQVDLYKHEGRPFYAHEIEREGKMEVHSLIQQP